MDITINARHMDITDSIREYVQEKAEKLSRFFDRIVNVEIIMDMDSGSPLVEIVVNASHNSTFVGKHRGEDMYGCIDRAIHKVEEQLRRHKDKVREHKGPTHEEQIEQAAAQPNESTEL